MASSEGYLAYVLDLLGEVPVVTHRKMMGEYMLYSEGVLFGGIYVYTKDPASMILLHFLTDFSSQIFQSSPSPLNVVVVVLFLAVLAFITYYGILLARKTEAEQ